MPWSYSQNDVRYSAESGFEDLQYDNNLLSGLDWARHFRCVAKNNKL